MAFSVDTALKGASLLGKLFGGGAKGAADNRAARDQSNVYRDRTNLDAISEHEKALLDRAQLEMAQRKMDAESRDSGYKRALHSQYLQNWTPSQRPDGVQMIRGGFNTISDAQRGVAKEAERQALLKLMNGEHFDALPAMQRFTPTPEAKQGTFEKISGLLGLGLQAAPTIYGMFHPDDKDSK